MLCGYCLTVFVNSKSACVWRVEFYSARVLLKQERQGRKRKEERSAADSQHNTHTLPVPASERVVVGGRFRCLLAPPRDG